MWLTSIAKIKLSTNCAASVEIYERNAYDANVSFLHMRPITAFIIAFNTADAANAQALPNTTYQVPPIVLFNPVLIDCWPSV